MYIIVYIYVCVYVYRYVYIYIYIYIDIDIDIYQCTIQTIVFDSTGLYSFIPESVWAQGSSNSGGL